MAAASPAPAVGAPRSFLLPDLGEGLAEAQILNWLVSVGDTVAVDQPVAEVETAKAVVELPSPYAGRVTRLHGEAGEFVAVGCPLLTVADAEPQGAAGPGGPPSSGSGNVLVGYGTVELTRCPTRPGPARPSTRSPGAAPAPATSSPLVRRLARAAGIDLASVRGSGPEGLIVRRDVQDAIDARDADPRADRAAAEGAAVDGAAPGELRTPIRGALKAAADLLSLSHREIPDATTWVDVDVTELLALRVRLNDAAREGERISLPALFARLCVLALADFPELNVRVDTVRQELVRNPGVNLGFAVQGRRGLAVPVLHAAHRLDLTGLSAELNRLTGRARAGSLTAEDLSGGTFTVNNYGSFGVDGATPIINHPEAAMLGIGRVAKHPWVVSEPGGDRMAIRQIVQLSLTFDHRVCDGACAGGFLRQVSDMAGQPLLLLRHV